MPKKKEESKNSRQRKALSPEDREKQMINLAVNLAEEQLRDGTASSQIITHFLKLATVREQLEKEKLENENKLLQAKAEAIESSKNMEELYMKALKAMTEYSGENIMEDDYYE